MNDFTKDELEQIRDDLEFEMSMYRMANNQFNINLLNKTQRMIDNYDADVIKVWHCEKCGQVQFLPIVT